jgi:hypothetical protein
VQVIDLGPADLVASFDAVASHVLDLGCDALQIDTSAADLEGMRCTLSRFRVAPRKTPPGREAFCLVSESSPGDTIRVLQLTKFNAPALGTLVSVTGVVKIREGIPYLAPRTGRDLLEIPVYEPGRWNNGTMTDDGPDPDRWQDQNNCLRYALNLPWVGAPSARPAKNQHYLHPGFSGNGSRPASHKKPPFNPDYNCAAFVELARADGLRPLDFGESCSGFRVALVTGFVFEKIDRQAGVPDTIGKRQDYHWYREDADGTWSHKPGSKPATNLDAAGNVITDPLSCARGVMPDGTPMYGDFCGIFCVTPDAISRMRDKLGTQGSPAYALAPADAVRGTAGLQPAAMEKRSQQLNGIVASVSACSGEPDTSFEFTEAADRSEVEARLAGLQPAQSQGWPAGLGNQGFVLEGEPLAGRARAVVRVWNGVIEIDADSARSYFVDAGGLEEWLVNRFSAVTTVDVPSEPPAVGTEAIRVSPSPAVGDAMIHFTVTASSSVEIRVFDVAGRVVALPVSRSRYPAGSHSVRFPSDFLPPGVYQVVLSSGSTRVSACVVHVR